MMVDIPSSALNGLASACAYLVTMGDSQRLQACQEIVFNDKFRRLLIVMFGNATILPHLYTGAQVVTAVDSDVLSRLLVWNFNSTVGGQLGKSSSVNVDGTTYALLSVPLDVKLVQLAQTIARYFSKGEVESELLFDVGVDHELFPSSTKPELVEYMLRYMAHTAQLESLVQLMVKKRAFLRGERSIQFFYD